MRDGGIGRWPCAAAHMLNRVIKNTMKRVNNNNSIDLLIGLEGNKVQSSTSKENRRKRGIKKINDYPETR